MARVRTHLRSLQAVGFCFGLALATIGCAASAPSGNASAGATPGITFARTTSWRTFKIPGPAGSIDSSLTSISCLSATKCVAAGTAFTSTANSPEAFAVTYMHGAWTPATVLAMPPDTTSSQLNGVSCVATGVCVAVGTYQTQAGPSFGLIAEQSGGNWAPVTGLPLPAGEEIGALNGVTCTAPGDCVAVGSVNTTRDGEMPMVVAEVNGRWRLPSVIKPPAKPTPNYGGDQLWSVACQRTGYCVAVGEYNVTADSAQLVSMPMMATESGGRWLPARGLNAPGDVARIPNAPGVGTIEYAGLKSVSCVPRGRCLAAGTYVAAQAQYRSLAVSDLNGKWGAPQELIPGQGGASACTTAYCLIAASGAGPTSPATAISYAGGRWSQVAAIYPPADASRSALPGHGYQLEISGVVCFAAGHCVAVGSYIDKFDRRVPMIAARS